MIKQSMRYGLLTVVSIYLYACANIHHHAAEAERMGEPEIQLQYSVKVNALQQELAALDEKADTNEAQRIAETAIRHSAYLAEKYRLFPSPIIHNLFVRAGLKQRGLCYHWTEDLLARLLKLNLKSFQLHWAVAHQGSILREHNCVVVTARGKAFAEGIVLDAWRNSGDLYWVRVSKDRYPWQPLPRSEWRIAISNAEDRKRNETIGVLE